MLRVAGVEIAEHVAHVGLGRGDLDLHDGLEQARAGLARGQAQSLADRGFLSRGRGGVGPVLDAGDHHLDVLEGIALGARAHGLGGALQRGLEDRARRLRDPGRARHLLGRRDGQLDHVAAAARAGGHAHAGLTEQRLVLDLALEARLGLGRAGQGLAVHDLRPADVGLDAVLAAQAVDHDVEVKLAHAADDGLSGLGILAEAEGRILVGQLGQTEVQPLLLGLGLGLDGARDDRLVRVDAAEQDGRLGRVQRCRRCPRP